MPDEKKIEPAAFWQLRTQTLNFDQSAKLMGIVNVTPDSFSDGGNFMGHQAAIEHALEMAESGADIIDVGGESTRPYSEPVSLSEELNRVVAVIEGVCKHSKVPVSIDTSKAEVAQAAIDAGAEIINDVTGLEGDPKMVDVAIESGAGICAMHMQGTPQTMQDNPVYENVVDEIIQYLDVRKTALLDAGIPISKICLDPGIGFGKTHEHNLELIASAHRFHELGSPILVGHSRKGFIGKILENKEADRDNATRAITLLLATAGIQIIRVHEVEQTSQVLKVLNSLRAIQNKTDV